MEKWLKDLGKVLSKTFSFNWITASPDGKGIDVRLWSGSRPQYLKSIRSWIPADDGSSLAVIRFQAVEECLKDVDFSKADFQNLAFQIEGKKSTTPSEDGGLRSEIFIVKDNWNVYPDRDNLPADLEKYYVTVIGRGEPANGRETFTKKVMKARYLRSAVTHLQWEGNDSPRNSASRWEGPGWYTDGGELGMDCWDTSLLYHLEGVVAWMPIPKEPEPYSGLIV